MMNMLIIATAAIVAVDAQAQENDLVSGKLLTQAECSQIAKLSNDEFYIKGPIIIANGRMTDTKVPRRAIGIGGVDMFDLISRSCFKDGT
jgi:hypothetical protein